MRSLGIQPTIRRRGAAVAVACRFDYRPPEWLLLLMIGPDDQIGPITNESRWTLIDGHDADDPHLIRQLHRAIRTGESFGYESSGRTPDNGHSAPPSGRPAN